MELKYVYITGYKNLVDTRLEFRSTQTPITIIVNDGLGAEKWEWRVQWVEGNRQFHLFCGQS